MSAPLNKKKRSLQDLEEEDDDLKQSEPPSKKIKITEESDIKSDIKSDTDVDKIRKLFQIDTNSLSNRYAVYQHFQQLSLALIRDLILILPKEDAKKTKLFQFVEFEFYCLDKLNHADVYSHCDDLQLTTNASWYFHKSGNNSVKGYEFMKNRDSEQKTWINPRPNVAFRNGTYKGMDITFGENNKHFGGILIRSIQELKPLNCAFTANKQETTYSPSDIIEGPCKCVDKILTETGFKSLKELTSSNRFDLNIFGNKDKDNLMYLDLAKKYNIQQLSPQKSKHSGDDNQYFYNSPRVGLTLKPEKSLSGKPLENFQSLKLDYVFAPYRTIRLNALSKLKKYKPLIALSMVYNNYYLNKLNDSKEMQTKEEKQMFLKNAEKYGPYKGNKLNNLIKQCQIGQNDKEKIINSAKKKFPTSANELAKLFGALI